MYRYYKKKEYDVMEYAFDSITEFINYIDNTPINEKIWGNKFLESTSNDYNFCKTHSFEEAEEMCKFGYHEDFEKLVELKLTLEKYIKMSNKRNRPHNFYVGYAPDVKTYLEGNPLSMINKQNPKRKHIDVYYNVSVPWYTSAAQCFNRGATTLCIVEILEKLGFSVGLNMFEMSKYEEQIFYAKFNLKRDGERLNVQKLYFPLCHSSFLRRLIFRLQEETPDITYGWTGGYGKPCDDYTIRDVIDLKEDSIVICLPEEMHVKGKDIIDDANAMFDYINKFTSEDIELQHVKKFTR